MRTQHAGRHALANARLLCVSVTSTQRRTPSRRRSGAPMRPRGCCLARRCAGGGSPRRSCPRRPRRPLSSPFSGQPSSTRGGLKATTAAAVAGVPLAKTSGGSEADQSTGAPCGSPARVGVGAVLRPHPQLLLMVTSSANDTSARGHGRRRMARCWRHGARERAAAPAASPTWAPRFEDRCSARVQTARALSA